MSGNNFLSSSDNIFNESENSKGRFIIATEKEVDELVENAQAQSTKYKTIYAVNIFKGTYIFTILNLIDIH